MRLVADLHVHSRFSRATSRGADLAGYFRWAQIKGIDVVATGDFTHPAWLAELSSQLEEKDGLYALKSPPRESGLEDVSPAGRPVRFMPVTEISSIYRKHGQVRKVHSLIGVRTLEEARRIGVKLAGIGNLASDGRPILGLDPKDLLAIVLETSPDGFLIPAHIWTPWFSLFGSKSGFDRIEDCFEELTPHIFALETGLSSDPPMNWRWSALDRYRLVSNSDAHSPPNLGREANLLEAEPSWTGVTGALRTGNGFLGTLEFYPEEGKYHLDGHRKCAVCLDPEQTAASRGDCPVCGKPLTIGVLNRVLSLADRRAARQPRPTEGFRHIIPLPELLSELAGSGSTSRAVSGWYARCIAAFGSEYGLLLDAPVEEIARSQGSLLAEGVRRMREGRVSPRPGYDGEFGVIRVFDDSELERLRGQDDLFSLPGRQARRPASSAPRIPAAARAPLMDAPSAGDAGSLDAVQAAIVASDSPRVLVSAGPGSGKTRLLVHWIARLAAQGPGTPGRILALTFTNRAAAELAERLEPHLRGGGGAVTAATFHSFCWSVLRERAPELRTIITASDRRILLAAVLPDRTPAAIQALADRMERCWEGIEAPDAELRAAREPYDEALRRIGGADISSLVVRVNDLLQSDRALLRSFAERYRAIAVDELQDVNKPQYELLLLLCASMPAVFCIGDPDQAIYGFRGSDRSLFFRFKEEMRPAACHMMRSFRSTAAIVAAADAVIAPGRTPGVPPLSPVRPEGAKVRIVEAADPGAEGRAIAAAIRDLVGGVDAVSVDSARDRAPGDFSFSDIAVLFRTRAVRDALLPSLQEAGLPLTAGAHTPLAEEEPFRSLVAALRLVANPEDLVARHVLAGSEQTGAAPGTLDQLLARGPDLARAASSNGIPALLDLVMGPIVRMDLSRPEVAMGEEIIRAEASRHGGDLPGFLAHVSLCARESEGPRAAQKVSLLTFHAAKGLEFPVVFIAGAEEGITPRANASEEELAEERRLFYVAITRARDELHISHCRRRRVHGQLADAAASRFLRDIPSRLRIDETPRARDRQLSLF